MFAVAISILSIGIDLWWWYRMWAYSPQAEYGGSFLSNGKSENLGRGDIMNETVQAESKWKRFEAGGQWLYNM